MLGSRKWTVLITALIAAPMLSACSFKIVQKPAVKTVEKLAVVSVYGNRTPYNMQGGGGLTALVGAIGNAGADDTDSDEGWAKRRLVNYATNRLAKELRTVEGWTVVSTARVLKSKRYQAWRKETKEEAGGFMSAMGAMSYVTPKNMAFAPIETSASDEELQSFAKLAKSLGMDAVIVAGIDMAYKETIGIGMVGAAKAVVQMSIKVITKDGQFAVKTADLSRGGGQRFASDDSNAIVSGNIVLEDKTEEMYKDAIDQAVDYYVQRIQEELAEPEEA